ncbi:hypothetical protein Ddye_023647 [Dipteronia dyeriana]|uniref:Uncharacterized protein n=1 Tax=Dipteronia dyeriana TaxID=168575 RepID=A0AAD9TUB3_9ROSI|nr:hypothetical protein Ddye_023647 [Dipteronia dyeriana]
MAAVVAFSFFFFNEDDAPKVITSICLEDELFSRGYVQKTLHGRKGLPVTAMIALLNTIYKEYEHAVIGTCLSTLYAGAPRNKLLPNPQLLRLKDWFSRYDFTVKHIKRNNNIVSDMLSITHHVTLISRAGPIPLLYMITSTASSSSFSPAMPSTPNFPSELMATLPPGQSPSVQQIQSFAKTHLHISLSQRHPDVEDGDYVEKHDVRPGQSFGQ